MTRSLHEFAISDYGEYINDYMRGDEKFLFYNRCRIPWDAVKAIFKVASRPGRYFNANSFMNKGFVCFESEGNRKSFVYLHDGVYYIYICTFQD
jgi:hypothetical protein